MKDFDFISHNSWKAKIYISCFPGLNEQKIFNPELMEQTLESLAKLGCTNIISLVESHEIEDICGLDFFLINSKNMILPGTICPSWIMKFQTRHSWRIGEIPTRAY